MIKTGIFIWPQSSRCTITPYKEGDRPLIYNDPNYGEDQIPSSWPVAFNVRRNKFYDDASGEVVASQFYAIARWKEGISGGRVNFRGWNWPKKIDDIEAYYSTQPFWSDYTHVSEGYCEFGNCEASIYSPMIYGDQAKQSALIGMTIRRSISNGDPEYYWHGRCFKEGCQIIPNNRSTTAWPLLILPVLLVLLRNRYFSNFAFVLIITLGIIIPVEEVSSAQMQAPIIEVFHEDQPTEKLEHVPGLRIASGSRDKTGGCNVPPMVVHTGVITDETGEEYVTSMNGHIYIEIDGDRCNVIAGELENTHVSTETRDVEISQTEGMANSSGVCRRAIRAFTTSYWRSLLFEEIILRHPEEGRHAPYWSWLTWHMGKSQIAFEISDNGTVPLNCYDFYGNASSGYLWGWMYSTEVWPSLRYHDTSGYGRSTDSFGNCVHDTRLYGCCEIFSLP